MVELSVNEETRKGDQEEEQKGAVPCLTEGAGRLKVKEREERERERVETQVERERRKGRE